MKKNLEVTNLANDDCDVMIMMMIIRVELKVGHDDEKKKSWSTLFTEKKKPKILIREFYFFFFLFNQWSTISV